ncbi:MAG: DUF1800 domain-containing protein [Vulcanimicrobiota bacterium]
MSLDIRQACWLLRCTGFGASPTEVARVRKLGAAAWLDEQLRAPLGEVAPPLVTRLPPGQILTGAQLLGLIGWWMGRLAGGGGLREKMTLFWHGFFTSSIDPVFSTGLLFCQNQLLRENALGRFSDLLLKVSQDPAMLVYLDGFRNRPEHPNENYAREVMELFTTGPGNYSEEDLRQAARAFTGWELAWLEGGQFRSNPAHHDSSSKRFKELRGQLDGEQILHRLARDPATGRHVCGRLWEFFCGQPTEQSELQRLAAVFESSHGNMAVVLKALFSGEAFQETGRGRQGLKSPVELCCEIYRILGRGYGLFEAKDLNSMGQLPFMPPSVAGWRQGNGWVDTSTLQARLDWIYRRVDKASGWRQRGQELIAGCKPAQAAERLLWHCHQQDAGPQLRAVLAQHYQQPEILQLVLASPEVQLK